MIDGTDIIASMISRYFSPSKYNENGFMSLTAVTQNLYSLNSSERLIHEIQVMQNAITYYNFMWLDTSQISTFNLGDSLDEYKVDTQSSVWRKI